MEKELLDRASSGGFDFDIGIKERQLESRGQPAADAGFARTHQANQNHGFGGSLQTQGGAVGHGRYEVRLQAGESATKLMPVAKSNSTSVSEASIRIANDRTQPGISKQVRPKLPDGHQSKVVKP
ncbi:hypothetical protein WCLP8_4890002 [uncultured Gammaproteobacteria bacterium]